MKIAIFSDVYLDIDGGIAASISAQKCELERLGHTVYLFTTGYKRSKEEIAKLKKDNIFVVPSCKVFFKPIIPLSRRPAVIEKWLLKNFPELKDFDVFHAHYESGCSIAGIRLARELNKPIIQTMHGREDVGEAGIIPHPFKTFTAYALNVFHSWYLPHGEKISRDEDYATTVARAKMWTLMVNHANAADIVITPSEHFKKKLQRYKVSTPIAVVPNAVKDGNFPDKCLVRKLEQGEPIHLLWHSRLSGEKRFMELLEALSYVKHDYVLDVYGDGQYEHVGEAYVKMHKLNVIFHGARPLSELFKVMEKCHLDLMMSYNYDTFAMTLIEAESTGLPVLFCDPDMKEIVPDGSFVLADSPEPKAVAAAIDAVCEHPEMIEKMSKIMIQNREEVKQSKRILKLIAVYDKMKK